MTPADLRDMLWLEIEQWSRLGHPAILQRFVWKHGVGSVGMPRPPALRRGKQKECFRNAAHLCIEHGFAYVEGYVASKRIPFPILHAWAMDGEQLIDVTLVDPVENVYFGVPFTVHELTQWLLKQEFYGLLDNGLTVNLDLIREHDPELLKGVTWTLRTGS